MTTAPRHSPAPIRPSSLISSLLTSKYDPIFGRGHSTAINEFLSSGGPRTRDGRAVDELIRLAGAEGNFHFFIAAPLAKKFLKGKKPISARPRLRGAKSKPKRQSSSPSPTNSTDSIEIFDIFEASSAASNSPPRIFDGLLTPRRISRVSRISTRSGETQGSETPPSKRGGSLECLVAALKFDYDFGGTKGPGVMRGLLKTSSLKLLAQSFKHPPTPKTDSTLRHFFAGPAVPVSRKPRESGYCSSLAKLCTSSTRPTLCSSPPPRAIEVNSLSSIHLTGKKRAIFGPTPARKGPLVFPPPVLRSLQKPDPRVWKRPSLDGPRIVASQKVFDMRVKQRKVRI